MERSRRDPISKPKKKKKFPLLGIGFIRLSKLVEKVMLGVDFYYPGYSVLAKPEQIFLNIVGLRRIKDPYYLYIFFIVTVFFSICIITPCR